MYRVNVTDPQRRTLPAILDIQAKNNGDTKFLWSAMRQLSFAETAETTLHLAEGLRQLGLAKGDLLTLLMKPSIDAVLLAFAASRLGAIFSTINTDFNGKFLCEAINSGKSRLLIIDEDLIERLDEIELKYVTHIFVCTPEGDLRRFGELETEPFPLDKSLSIHEEISWSDPVQVWWSSGTTGKSKGILHSGSSLLTLAFRSSDGKVQEGDVYYSCTPMYLGSSWTGTIYPALVNGVTAAIDSKFSVSAFWDRIMFYGATHFFTLGSMHIYLWNQSKKESEGETTVRHAQCIPMSWDLIPKFKERFGIAHMSQAYGTSESFMVFQAEDDGCQSWTGGAMGRALPHLEVKLMDEDDREVPIGKVGEICVRPKEPGVMFSGYFNDPERTVDAWRNLWHHTGDMARCDDDGIYYFADRKKDYIRYAGRNISMFEVEAVAIEHPHIIDVAAYGIASEELESESELALAVVAEMQVELTAEDVAEFINKHAPYFFVPRYIHFLQKLPKNAHGRVMKHEIRDLGLPEDAWDRKKTDFVVVR